MLVKKELGEKATIKKFPIVQKEEKLDTLVYNCMTKNGKLWVMN